MSVIDPTVPADTENASLGASRIRASATWVDDAWTAFIARHHDGSTPGDPGTSSGEFNVPTSAPGSPKAGDFYNSSNQLIGYVAASPTPEARAWGDVPSATKSVFQQATAPNLWTRDTGLTNSSVLRYVTGAPGTGGSRDPVSGDVPAHTHSYTDFGSSGSQIAVNSGVSTIRDASAAQTTGSTGTGATMDLQYVDIILCTKS